MLNVCTSGLQTEDSMPRQQKDPLRGVTEEERLCLEQLSRAQREAAAHVARAKALLAVADGMSFSDAARTAGRRSGDAIAHLVARFNSEGLGAIEPRRNRGRDPLYGNTERERILQEVRRTPEREQDGTNTWSLTTLQRALRQAPDGLPHLSTYTIWCVLHDAGLSWQRDRSWCETGSAQRVRKQGVVCVTDPDTEAKKSSLSRHIRQQH